MQSRAEPTILNSQMTSSSIFSIKKLARKEILPTSKICEWVNGTSSCDLKDKKLRVVNRTTISIARIKVHTRDILREMLQMYFSICPSSSRSSFFTWLLEYMLQLSLENVKIIEKEALWKEAYIIGINKDWNASAFSHWYYRLVMFVPVVWQEVLFHQSVDCKFSRQSFWERNSDFPWKWKFPQRPLTELSDKWHWWTTTEPKKPFSILQHPLPSPSFSSLKV